MGCPVFPYLNFLNPNCNLKPVPLASQECLLYDGELAREFDPSTVAHTVFDPRPLNQELSRVVLQRFLLLALLLDGVASSCEAELPANVPLLFRVESSVKSSSQVLTWVTIIYVMIQVTCDEGRPWPVSGASKRFVYIIDCGMSNKVVDSSKWNQLWQKKQMLGGDVIAR